MRIRSRQGLTCAALALSLVGGTAASASAEGNGPPTDETSRTRPAEKASAWDLTKSKLSPEEIAAFRKRQGFKGDGVKDQAWLTSLRRKLGTGEFAAPAKTTDGQVNSALTPQSSNVVTSGSGYSYIGWMVQRRQATSSACGKATVSEMSATVPGPSSYSLAQSTVASYMGTLGADGNYSESTASATNTTEEVRALGHFVGEPNFGRSFYEFAWLSDPPTSTQKSRFLSNLKADIANYKTPVVTGVIEVKDGPRLNGHPNLSRIEHWVIAGGWNDNNATIQYADSWTDYGYSIPAKSWISRSTFLYAAGGWGYAW